MKKKGFTLVELLVVIAIIALLMGILMPALARVRAIAFRMVCGSNLSGIGKAMLIYANDYEDEFPRGGCKGSTLKLTGTINNWMAPDRDTAFGATLGVGGSATVTSCLYLLIRYAEVTPKSFICKGDSGATEFKLSDETGLPVGFELIQAWDFGSAPTKHCSYSYHQPLHLTSPTYSFALTTSSDPGMAIAADRNPWLSNPLVQIWPNFLPAPPPSPGGTPEQQMEGNSTSHGEEGQNVLFLDSHVFFEKRSYCAIEDDNIYTSWTMAMTPEKRKGAAAPTPAVCLPRDRKDSLLVINK
jgi:prepilin-type N-terminal cleavage/methylation domain-containing protein